jgi:hypothetical protein
MCRVKLSRAAWLALGASVAGYTPNALAVLTYGTGNNYVTSTPAPGNVDMYEGDFNSFTGTAVAPRFMLSANHVVGGPTGQFEFNNGTATATTYNIQLVASVDDLACWEIAPSTSTNFSVYAPIYTGSSETGSTVVDLGRGFVRGPAIAGGWSWLGGQGPLSWGTNTVASIDTNTQLGTSGSLGGDFLQYDFDNNSSNPNECIITMFDSGGGVFINDNGTYKLAGVNSLVDSVFDSSGNAIQGSLYDVYGYYTYNSSNHLVQITQHGPESSYATRVSSRATVVELADGQIPASQAAANPISNDGLLSIYSNLTTGAITGGAQLQVGGLGAGATMQIAKGSGASVLTALTVNSFSTLDITNNQIFVDYGSGTDPIASIAGWVKSGFNNGAWNGYGIISTSAQTNANYGIGYADAADQGNPAGLSSGQIELRYTLLGDANLDGKVNGTDFAILAANFNQSVSGWDDGDFNYDGKANGTDFTELAANFNQGVSASVANEAALQSFESANGLASSLPEPGSALGLGVLLISMMRRRHFVSRDPTRPIQPRYQRS